MSKTTAKHVLYHNGEWVIKTQDQSLVGAAKVYDTQREAVQVARALAKKSKADLVIHGRDGRIRDVDSYSEKPSAVKLIPTPQ